MATKIDPKKHWLEHQQSTWSRKRWQEKRDDEEGGGGCEHREQREFESSQNMIQVHVKLSLYEWSEFQGMDDSRKTSHLKRNRGEVLVDKEVNF